MCEVEPKYTHTHVHTAEIDEGTSCKQGLKIIEMNKAT